MFCYLKMLQAGGYIEGLQRHGSVRLTEAKISYKPDFQAFHKEFQAQVYYEAKGVETERWCLVKRLWKVYGPGRLFIYKGNVRGVYLSEEIIPERTGGV